MVGLALVAMMSVLGRSAADSVDVAVDAGVTSQFIVSNVVGQPFSTDVAEQIREMTGGRGADVCLEVTGNYRALHEAIRAVAYSSRVCVAGFMQGEGTGLFLG